MHYRPIEFAVPASGVFCSSAESGMEVFYQIISFIHEPVSSVETPINITHLGTMENGQSGYNATTGFSTSKGFIYPIGRKCFVLMLPDAASSFLKIRNLPVVFRGGGFAGRAGLLFQGLRFLSSSN